MSNFIDVPLCEALVRGVVEAGNAILEVYEGDISVETKEDDSPLTQADLASHHLLVAMLQRQTPEIPILSEESDDIPYAVRRSWHRYWLLDPLDGTKEFIQRSGEFTVNVALIEQGVPVFGIVHAPVLGTTWYGQQGKGAFKLTGNNSTPIHVRGLANPEQTPWTVVGSRLHGARELEEFCKWLPAHRLISMGSSLKLCLVAEGTADLYPRLAPTSEWDTAAAQAVITAAGGEVLSAETLEPLLCNQHESVLNPSFIACNQRDPRWVAALSMPRQSA